MLEAIKEEVPKASGELGDSYNVDVEINGGELTLRAMTPLQRAEWIIHGTPEHVIVPTVAEALHFQARSGDEVFTKMVHHPGTKPDDYIARAAARVADEMASRFSAAVGDHFRINV